MKAAKAPTFESQAARWLQEGQLRKLDPIRPRTALNYKSQIETHLNPLIGKLTVDVVGNKAVRDVVASLAARGLSAATIQLNINIIKQIRGSAVNQEGEQLYPYTWNSRFIDAPAIENQKRPVQTAQAVQGALNLAASHERALYAVLAGAGLRISEALALTAAPNDDGKSTVWLPSESKIIVRQQWNGTTFGPTKTKAGVREIDLCSKLNSYLIANIKLENHGLMFPNSQNYYRQQAVRHGIIGGFHSLRRFRVTYLRMQGVPDSLVHFWIGHEDSTVTGRYTEVGSEIEARKNQAEKVGLGFELETV